MTTEHLPLLVELDSDPEVLHYIIGRGREEREVHDRWGPIPAETDAGFTGRLRDCSPGMGSPRRGVGNMDARGCSKTMIGECSSGLDYYREVVAKLLVADRWPGLPHAAAPAGQRPRCNREAVSRFPPTDRTPT
jgi:hypothetical protein